MSLAKENAKGPLRVLVIEDEVAVREVLTEALKLEGHAPFCSANGDQVLEDLREHEPDIVLLDQRLPGQMGTEVLRQIRNDSVYRTLPVIMVTGATSESEKIEALDLGADDYVTKPFQPGELVARIRAVIRRAEGARQIAQVQFGELSVDLSSHKVFLHQNEISLTLTEFRILGALVRENGKVLSRDRLREDALGNLGVSDRTIDVHMASLRKKLGEYGESIQTVRGVGYRMSNESIL